MRIAGKLEVRITWSEKHQISEVCTSFRPILCSPCTFLSMPTTLGANTWYTVASVSQRLDVRPDTCEYRLTPWFVSMLARHGTLHRACTPQSSLKTSFKDG